MDKILLTPFTISLRVLILELTKRGALPQMGEFSRGLSIMHSTLNKVQRGERNYPEEKIPDAKKYLYEYFGVNKKWWDNPKLEMFDWEPAQRRFAPSKQVKIDLLTLKAYEAMAKELEKCKEEKAQLEQTLGIAAEPTKIYKKNTNPDNNSDKKPKK